MKDEVYNSLMERAFVYLTNMFGGDCIHQSFSKALPLYLRRFRPSKIVVRDIELLLAFVDEDVSSAEEYERLVRSLDSLVKVGKVVFVFESLSSLKRNQLIQRWVSFLVPGRQFFLPPLMQLTERATKSPIERATLSPSAQAILIRQLLCRDVKGCSADEIARILGLSKVAVHSAFEELSNRGLATLVDHWPQRIDFDTVGRQLWDKAFPLLRSPVKQVLFNAMPGFDHWVKAGDSAMAKLTCLAQDTLPVYACKNGEQKSLNQFVKAENRYEARSVLQVWWYDPLICGGKELVDPLSLYLSLRDSNDPRIQGELETLLGGVKW